MGVDLVPFKTCSYDCIYCQLGRTTRKTTQCREWIPLDDVLSELKQKLSTKPNYVTLSGSGEPTLYSRLGELIAGIRSMTDVPVAVLTNGSMLWHADIRRELMDAELVIPSLDAGDAELFQAINRPHVDVSFASMLEGLVSFGQEFHGRYWLEVFILSGYNDGGTEIRRLAECVSRIRPERVQLNTATRPTAEDYAVMVSRRKLTRLARCFDPPAEVIADYRDVHARAEFQAGREGVLQLLRRRPCSLGDIAEGLAMHRNEVIKYVEELHHQGKVEKETTDGKVFYRVTR